MIKSVHPSEGSATSTPPGDAVSYVPSEIPALRPAIWSEPPPLYFGSPRVWSILVPSLLLATLLSIFFLDGPVARWAIANQPLAWPPAGKLPNDVVREFRALEQYGQYACTFLVIAAVGLIDKAGRRRALAISVACFYTVICTFLLKDTFGRARPWEAQGNPFVWGGPTIGFTHGSNWSSFPSAHTTGAFALSYALSYFYPKGRYLFMSLAVITAAQRVLNHAHFVSDTIIGILVAMSVSHITLRLKIAGRSIAMAPKRVQKWWFS